jgi:hypothetical protein
VAQSWKEAGSIDTRAPCDNRLDTRPRRRVNRNLTLRPSPAARGVNAERAEAIELRSEPVRQIRLQRARMNRDDQEAGARRASAALEGQRVERPVAVPHRRRQRLDRQRGATHDPAGPEAFAIVGQMREADRASPNRFGGDNGARQRVRLRDAGLDGEASPLCVGLGFNQR